MYQTIDQVPSDIRDKLPDEACELYVAAYNRILEKETAAGETSEIKLHERAHEGAMLTVRTEFEPNENGHWQRAPMGKEMDRIGPAASNEAATVLSANDGDDHK